MSGMRPQQIQDGRVVISWTLGLVLTGSSWTPRAPCMSSKWLLTVTLSVNRSLISMKRPDWMRETTLAGTGRKDIDKLRSSPAVLLLVGGMAVGGNAPDGMTNGAGGLAKDEIGTPDSGTVDSSERDGRDPKGAPAYNQATVLTCTQMWST